MGLRDSLHASFFATNKHSTTPHAGQEQLQTHSNLEAGTEPEMGLTDALPAGNMGTLFWGPYNKDPSI